MRHEYCKKNGIMITYTDPDVAFEDTNTAESILVANDGTIIHNNFDADPQRTQKFLDDFRTIYPTICYLRPLGQ